MGNRLWDDNKREAAEELIHVLLNHLTQAGGIPLENEVMIALRELSALSKAAKLHRAPIHFALQAMQASGQQSIDDFEMHYEESARRNLPVALDVPWNFLIPLEMEMQLENVENARITILDREFRFRTKDAVYPLLGEWARGVIDHPELATWYTRENVDVQTEVFLEVSEFAQDAESAWNTLTPAFDALRGLIEFTFGFMGSQYSFGGTSFRRKVPPPLWVQGQKESGDAELLPFLVDHGKAPRPLPLTQESLELLKTNATRLDRQVKQNSTLSLIANCLRLYSQAMDAKYLHDCFLGFWQLAEAITLSESIHGKTEEVVKRLCWHSQKLGLKGTGYKATLMTLGAKRNEVVHMGIRHIDDEDVNILKFACDAALFWLFQVCGQLETKRHLEHFYELRTQNDSEFAALLGAIEHIKKPQGITQAGSRSG